MSVKDLVENCEKDLYTIPRRTASMVFKNKDDRRKWQKFLDRMTEDNVLDFFTFSKNFSGTGRNEEVFIIWLDPFFKVFMMKHRKGNLIRHHHVPIQKKEIWEVLLGEFFGFHYAHLPLNPMDYLSCKRELSLFPTIKLPQLRLILFKTIPNPYKVRQQDKFYRTFMISIESHNPFVVVVDITLWEKNVDIPKKNERFSLQIVHSQEQDGLREDIMEMIDSIRRHSNVLQQINRKSFQCEMDVRHYNRIIKMTTALSKQYEHSSIDPTTLQSFLKRLILRIAVFSKPTLNINFRLNLHYDNFDRNFNMEVMYRKNDIVDDKVFHLHLTTDNDMELEHMLFRRYTIVYLPKKNMEETIRIFSGMYHQLANKKKKQEILQTIANKFQHDHQGNKDECGIFFSFEEYDDANSPVLFMSTQRPLQHFSQTYSGDAAVIPLHGIFGMPDELREKIRSLKELSLEQYRRREAMEQRRQQVQQQQARQQQPLQQQKEFFLPPVSQQQQKSQTQLPTPPQQQQQTTGVAVQRVDLHSFPQSRQVVKRLRKKDQAVQEHDAYVYNIQTYIQPELQRINVAKLLLQQAYDHKARRIIIVDAPNLLFNEFPHDFEGRETYTSSPEFRRRLIKMMGHYSSLDIYYVVSQMNIGNDHDRHLTFTSVPSTAKNKMFYYSRVACFDKGKNCYTEFGHNECDDYVRQDTLRRLWKLQEQVRAFVEKRLRQTYGVTKQMEDMICANRFSVLQEGVKINMERELRNEMDYPIVLEISNDHSRNWISI